MLVDLPGLSDAVEGRAKVARSFYKNLEVTAIVTPVIRAADEQIAMGLLSDSQALSMELDNKLNAKSFCVVTSKIDDIEPRTYCPGVENSQGGFQVQEKREQLEGLEAEFNDLNAVHKDGKAYLKTLRQTTKDRKREKAKVKKNDTLGSGKMTFSPQYSAPRLPT